MQQIRRTLLTVLGLVAVVAFLVGYPGASSASSSRTLRDTVVPMGSPQVEVHDPNTGEPDSGSSRSSKISLSSRRGNPGDDAQYAVRALRTIRWTSLVWAKRMFGVGD